MSFFLSILLAASWRASILAGIILAIQFISRSRIPARWRFALWFLVLIRLSLIPLPESRLSIFNLVPHLPITSSSAPFPVKLTLSVVSYPSPSLLPSNEPGGNRMAKRDDPIVPVIAALPIAAPAESSDFANSAPAPFPWVTLGILGYVLGLLLCATRNFIAMLAIRRTIRAASPVTDGALLALLAQAQSAIAPRARIMLLATDHLSSPALAGIFHPRLLLPRAMLSVRHCDLRFVFLHECAHLRRRDVLVNYWMAAVQTLHWFNPMVWLIVPRMRADRELACDEHVILATQDPAPYGHALLNLAQSTAPRAFPGTVGILEHPSSLSRRIHMIAAFKRTPPWLVVPALGLLALASACTLTGAVSRAADSPATQPVVKGDESAMIKVEATRSTPEEAARDVQQMIQVLTAKHEELAKMQADPRQVREAAAIAAEIADLSAVVRDQAKQIERASKNIQPDMTMTLKPAKVESGGTSIIADSLTLQVDPKRQKDVLDAMLSGRKIALTPREQQLVDNDATLKAMENELLQHEENRLVTASKFGPDHPDLKELDIRIDFLKARIADVREKLENDARQRVADAARAIPATTLRIYEVRDLIGANPDPNTRVSAEDPQLLELRKVIEETIRESNWNDHRMSTFNGSLIISTTDDCHVAVYKLLDELRSTIKAKSPPLK